MYYMHNSACLNKCSIVSERLHKKILTVVVCGEGNLVAGGHGSVRLILLFASVLCDV